MKVLHEEIKEKVIAHTQALKGVRCDECERLITPVWGRSNTNKYFDIVTGHNDWGSDSYESREHHDICPECVSDFVVRYLNNARGSEYIEIETEYCVPEDVRV